MNDILVHLWLACRLVAFGGCLEGIRRLSRRERVMRGERN